MQKAMKKARTPDSDGDVGLFSGELADASEAQLGRVLAALGATHAARPIRWLTMHNMHRKPENSLTALPRGAWAGLRGLRRLYLRGNDLAPGAVPWRELAAALTPGLEVLDLRGNARLGGLARCERTAAGVATLLAEGAAAHEPGGAAGSVAGVECEVAMARTRMMDETEFETNVRRMMDGHPIDMIMIDPLISTWQHRLGKAEETMCKILCEAQNIKGAPTPHAIIQTIRRALARLRRIIETLDDVHEPSVDMMLREEERAPATYQRLLNEYRILMEKSDPFVRDCEPLDFGQARRMCPVSPQL